MKVELYVSGSLSKTVEYAYDHINRMYSRVVAADNTRTIFVHDERNQIVLTLTDDNSGNVVSSDLATRNLWNPAVVDQALAEEHISSGDVYYPLTDHLNTVRDVAEYDSATDTTTISKHVTYDAYGQVTADSNTSLILLPGYTGKYKDPLTGDQYNINRWYDLSTGRWRSEDPIGFDAGDGNLYRYATNSPAHRVDPTGMFTISEPRGFLALNPSVFKPTDKRLKGGAVYDFLLQRGDYATIAQHVRESGSFVVIYDCGLSASVAWEEDYFEAWVRKPGKLAVDNHKVGPKAPATYLEDKLDMTFTGNAMLQKLWLVGKRDRKEVAVQAWGFYVQATFTVVNGYYRHPELAYSDEKFSDNDFPEPRLSFAPIGSGGTFNKLMWPGPSRPKIPRSLPTLTRGPRRVATDVWRISWEEGQFRPEVEYLPSGYR